MSRLATGEEPFASLGRSWMAGAGAGACRRERSPRTIKSMMAFVGTQNAVSACADCGKASMHMWFCGQRPLMERMLRL